MPDEIKPSVSAPVPAPAPAVPAPAATPAPAPAAPAAPALTAAEQNTAAMYTIAEEAQKGRNVASNNIQDALKVFEAVERGEDVPEPKNGPPKRKHMRLVRDDEGRFTAPAPAPASQAPAAPAAPAAAAPLDVNVPAASGTPASPSGAVPAAPANAEEPLSRGWAAIKTEERRILAEKEQIKQERAQLEQLRTAGLDAAGLQERMRADPFGVLAESGWTFDALLKAASDFNAGKPVASPVAPPAAKPASTEDGLRKEIAELKAQVNSLVPNMAVQNYQRELASTLKDPKYALLSTHPAAIDAAMETAAGYAKDTGQVLTPAAVLDTLQEEYGSYIRSLGSHEAVRAALGFGPAAPQAATPPSGNPPQAASVPRAEPKPKKNEEPTTVTNAMATEPGERKAFKDMPEQARIAEVAKNLRINWT